MREAEGLVEHAHDHDERIGTLDPETLVTVTKAIQQLGRGQRMVGIITQVPDFTAALPVRIEVVRSPDGSKQCCTRYLGLAIRPGS